jgi:ribonuclease-3 family protein
VGDAVYELYVRVYLIKKGLTRVKKLHEEASGLVRAARQADFLHKLESQLSEEEKDVARRGRNSKTGHHPKSSGMVEYRLSTGFEALLGYLFLMRREERIGELLGHLFDKIEAE